MNTPNMREPSGRSEHAKRRWVRVPHEFDRERLRKQAGRAYRKLQTGCDEIAEAIGLKSHAGVSRRRQGKDGPLAALLVEIDAMERRNIDTSPILEEIFAVQQQARATHGAFCPKQFAMEEQALDGAEDEAQTAYLTGRAGAHEWLDALTAYAVRVKQGMHALRKEVH